MECTATILRPLTCAGCYANLGLPKEANSRDVHNSKKTKEEKALRGGKSGSRSPSGLAGTAPRRHSRIKTVLNNTLNFPRKKSDGGNNDGAEETKEERKNTRGKSQRIVIDTVTANDYNIDKATRQPKSSYML